MLNAVFAILILLNILILLGLSFKYRNLPLYLVVCFFPILPAYFAFKVRFLPLLYGFRAVVLFFVLFEIVILLTDGKITAIKLFDFRGRKLLSFALVLFVAVNVVRLLISGKADLNAFVMNDLVEKVLLLCLIVNRVRTIEVFRKCLRLILAAALILGLFGLVEFIFGYNVFSLLNIYHDSALTGVDAYLRFGQVRIESAFGHPITYSLYLGMVLFISIYRLIEKRSLIGLIIYLVLLVNLCLGMSRGPMLVLIGCLILFTIFAARQLRSKILRYAAVVMIGLIFMLCGFENSLTVTIKKMPQMLMSLYDQKYRADLGDFGGNEEPFGYRLGLIKVIANAIRPKLLFGYGYHFLSNFSFIVINNRAGLYQESTSIDNHYLFELLCAGVAGLVAFIITNLSFLIVALNNWRVRLLWNDLNYYFIFIIIFYLGSLVTVAAMEERRIYWVLLALWCAYNNIGNQKAPLEEDSNSAQVRKEDQGMFGTSLRID